MDLEQRTFWLVSQQTNPQVASSSLAGGTFLRKKVEMGLGFSHSKAHWSYNGFNGFRHRLAKEIGLNLDDMQGYSRSNHAKSWDEIEDPIKDLLNHSDCEDDLTSEQCRTIAPRLRELVASWDDDDFIYSCDKQHALLLADGMEKAAAQNENLIFC